MTPERFWPKVQGGSVDECWEWTAFRNRKGYGLYGGSSRDGSRATQMAHRYAYGLLIAEIPAGLEVDHLCRNPSCVNPWHMEIVTKSINVARRNLQLAKPPTCVHGHPWTPANRYRKPDGTTKCRDCIRESSRKQRRRRLAA